MSYSRIIWENSPSTATPINAENLNKMDKGIYDLDAKVESLESKAFIATYNVTTAQELLEYLDSSKEPFAPVIVKRGGDYYTSVLSAKSGDKALVRVIGSGSGDFHIFTYTVTGSSWANSGHTLQKKLVSGTDIKTINGESLLGSGNIEVQGGITTAITAAELDAILV